MMFDPKALKAKSSNKKKVILLSEIMNDILQKPSKESTKVKDLVANFYEDSILLTMIFFSIPIAVPLPYPPGFTTIIGLPLALLSLQMILGYKNMRLPETINNFEIKNSLLIAIANKILPLLLKIEKYIKPRCSFPNMLLFDKLLGILFLIASLYVALPIPFTNAIPALGIAVSSLGLINKDGLTIIVGILIIFIGIAVATSFMLGGFALIKYLLGI